MSFFNDRDDAEDLFADTRMSFGDHLEELRWRLIRAISGAVLILIGVFVVDTIGWITGLPIGAGLPVMHFISRPVEREMMFFYQERLNKITSQLKAKPETTNARVPVHLWVDPEEFRKALDLPPGKGGTEPIPLQVGINPLEMAGATVQTNMQLIHPPLLSTLSVTEAFIVYIKVSLVLGIVIGSPWIFWQLWAFVAAGLYPQEKKYVHVYGPFSLGLFLAGVVLCECIVIPAAVHYLLGFNEWMGLSPDLRLSEWLSFALLTPLVLGVAFQTPLVILFLHKLGIVEVATIKKHRNLAWFVLAVVAVILAPSPDPVSYFAMYLPLVGLFELGILLCRFSPQTAFDDVPESEEVVEV
jgi:sec-independent protein translocase protein TatC